MSLTEGEGSRGVSAVLVVDMISTWDFPDGEALLAGARAVVERIAALKARCAHEDVPFIYANDNLGRWRSDFKQVVELSEAPQAAGRDITARLKPEAGDYFVLKPKHSAFYATPLELLLAEFEIRRLVVCGVSTDQCVMTTVAEARMRDYEVVVPPDCVATQSDERQAMALAQFERVHKIEVTPSDRLVLR